MFDKLIFVSLALQMALASQTASKAKTNPTPCAAANPGATNCAADSCNVEIGGQTFCSKCTGDKVPVNGECKAKTDAGMCTVGTNDKAGTCTACTNAHYLYKGGCYAECPDGTQKNEGRNTCDEVAPAGPTPCAAANPGATNCAADSCNVEIGGQTFCSKCTGDKVPVNGECKAKTDAGMCTVGTNDKAGTCTACTNAHYLYKGGCYAECPDGTQKNEGRNTCDEVAPAGPTPCAAANPGATNCAADSCNVEIGGQTFCSKCTGDKVPVNGECKAKTDAGMCTVGTNDKAGTCTACTNAHYLYKGGCYAECPDGTQKNEGRNTCDEVAPAGPTPCAAANPGATNCAADSCNVEIGGQTFCSKCTGDKVPVNGECKAKTDAGMCTVGTNDKAGTCTACTNAHYLYKGGCYAECPDGTQKNEGRNTCDEVAPAGCNLPNCEVCSEDKQKCTKCQSNYFLTPEKNACLGSCPAGTYLSGQTCAPCDPSCAECSGAGASKCTACPAGKMLRYADETKLNEGGQCVEQCVEGPECETCGLTIGGTKYCSKCKGSNVPLNGVCTSNAARTRFCTTAANGACTVCAAGYFIQEGGCYETTRQPGKQVCALTDNKGKCQTCTNSLGPDGAGTCPSCDPTCKTCSAANTANTCTTCATGYYKTALEGACTSCENSNGDITGVKDCLNCAPPPNNKGSVLCYLMKDGDSTGGSVNKSGLSTGAIAGISVAVIVVVGGLVGFLCWWFLCRGKA
eukprot:XP_001709724.1 VSP [Giardia lamblia ATCC 50803]